MNFYCKSTIGIVILGISLSACGGPAPATDTLSGAPAAKTIQQDKMYDNGNHIIYFNALTTDFLEPEIARANNITRSKSRAMVNISIQKKNADGSKTPVSANLNATVSNLTGQLKNVDWRKVSEGSAIYYLGLVNIADGETLIFDLQPIPEGQDESIAVRFQHRFFKD